MDLNIPQIKVSEYTECGEIHKSYLTPKYDRFIPNRSANDLETSHHLLLKKELTPEKVLNFSSNLKPIEFKFKQLDPTPCRTSTKRKVSTRSFLILDAPEVKSDFYYNLLDWSESSNLAVGLGKDVYLWNFESRRISKILSISKYNENFVNLHSNYVTSLKWINNETIAVGTESLVEIWDVNREKCITKIFDHIGKVTCMDTNNGLLTSGSYSSQKVLLHDFRMSTKINELHNTDFICGVKWNLSGRFLASSSYTGNIFVWDIVAGYQKASLYASLNEHQSSVKALSWCPWQTNLLASGGGKLDGKVKFFNVYNGKVLNEIDVGCQVTGIEWSKKNKEIVYNRNNELNDLVVRTYPKLNMVAELSGHFNVIISMALSKNEVLATLGSDETLRIWDCFKDDFMHRDMSSPISTKSFSRFQNIR